MLGSLLELPKPSAPLPFAVGEKLGYSAKLGMLTLGSGTLEVASVDTVRGVESFRFRFRLQGKTMFYSLDDVLESWVGTKDLMSRRFVQDFVENGKPMRRRYEIFPDSGFFREQGRDTTFATPNEPLDDAAFFYFVRLTPLQVGQKYTYNRYFRKDKNPVTHRGAQTGEDGSSGWHRGAMPRAAPYHRHAGSVLEALGDAHLAHG